MSALAEAIAPARHAVPAKLEDHVEAIGAEAPYYSAHPHAIKNRKNNRANKFSPTPISSKSAGTHKL